MALFASEKVIAAHVPRTHIEAMPEHLDLFEDIVQNDRYPFSPRIRTLRAILAKLRPEPVRGVQTHPSRKCANKFGAKTKIGHQLSARSRQTFILPNC